ncbi:hypothetical protein [Pedobacter metabolipauper]|uniref:Uncharacterized protein n=1 Tax=Pedobacter metabolipauper TaxID=425513 RepID=A0A4R6SQF1_9SPHI|nr:hypothetical protein [Pedobacter metabolipauper]TDQ06211.1 hypothetical protein ATK78_4592 [Pedobacter metabolipauper]
MKTFLKIWMAPIILAVISAVGLLSALIGDHLWDTISWLALGVPLIVGGYYLIVNLTRKKKTDAKQL